MRARPPPVMLTNTISVTNLASFPSLNACARRRSRAKTVRQDRDERGNRRALQLPRRLLHERLEVRALEDTVELLREVVDDDREPSRGVGELLEPHV